MTFLADRFAELLAHRRIEDDAENNAIVDALALAFADAFDRLGLVAFGDPEADLDGGRIVTDPEVAPLWALPHAALYTGAALPTRLADEDDASYTARARDAAVYPLGIRRGTHEAIRRRIQPYLEGAKTVFIADAYSGPYRIFVRTLIGETPDPALVEKVLVGDYVSGGEPGAIRAELVATYVAADYVAWPEATLRWTDVADGVTWANATREDLT